MSYIYTNVKIYIDKNVELTTGFSWQEQQTLNTNVWSLGKYM